MKQSTAISIGLHVAVLAWATLSYSGRAVEAPPPESLPVEFISEKDFSELTKGIKEAPKKEEPKPLAEKKDEPKPVEQPKAKVAKKEVKAEVDKTPEPTPEVKPPEEKKEAKAEPKPQPKIDPIADKLKEESAKKNVAEIAPKLPPRRPPRPVQRKPQFDADRIAALLDKREPMRTLATGEDLNTAPGLGTPSGLAARLSQSELDALRARLMALWNPPVGIKNPEDYVIRIRIRLGRDGKLTAPPQVMSSGHGQLFNSARDSAVRAVFRGQPFDMLKPEHYSVWKDIEVTFDPRDMFRG
jgi:colicin import membrane protein